MTRIIGLMSGTSVDGIDAVLVEITGPLTDLKVELLAGVTFPYPPALREQILAVCSGRALVMAELATLDDAIAQQFARAALSVQVGFPRAELIGSHGQTVYHRPPTPEALGYSLQLGRGATIARATGIPTVSNFRAADLAAGGQGAPLVPRVDAYLLGHPKLSRCVQNIGGIGNVAYLPARGTGSEKLAIQSWEQQVLGWDTGPGNVLLDLAVQHFSGGSLTYDRDGAWAASGTPREPLVARWLEHPFFRELPPKSTGRELFGPAFLQDCLAQAQGEALQPADVLATLTEFTAASIALSYRSFLPQSPDQILVCGGGSRNTYLRHRLQDHLAPSPVLATDDYGVCTKFKEAIAFAVLAYWRQQGIPGNCPQVTGAKQPVLLGEVNLVT